MKAADDAKEVLKRDLPRLRSLLITHVSEAGPGKGNFRRVLVDRNLRKVGKDYEELRLSICSACRDLGIDYPDRLWMSPGLTEYMNKIFTNVFTNSHPHPIEAVYADLKPFFQFVGLWAEEDEQLVPLARVHSSNWTGRRSEKEIAIAIRAMVPVAQAALDGLIEELERRRHNAGNLSPPERKALADLRILHSELGELIHILETEGGVAARLEKFAAAARRTFSVSSRAGVIVRGFEAGGLAIVPAFAFVKACELMFGPFNEEAQAAVAAAALGGTYMTLASRDRPKT